jgi:hypothetical protein
MAKIKKSDVDGTVPGRAVLLIVNVDDPDGPQGVMHALFVEGEYNCTDPQLSAQGLWESTKGDWPNHTHSIALNERARYLMAARRFRAVTTRKYTVAEFLEHENGVRR